MQLTEFRCGKQLVSITLDCLHGVLCLCFRLWLGSLLTDRFRSVAHHQAATTHKTRLIHRDISSENILIYPKVRLGEDGKSRSVVWTGMLTDWEFAKPMETERLSEANQVVRAIQNAFPR